MNRTLYSLIILLSAIGMRAGSLEELHLALQQSSVTQVQEKVYVHTDNTCYFVGDTLWYKAYVVRADNLKPTDMSRILYVELLSPDGLLVERQNIIVSPEGHTCGQFVLHDSLYSGYYELRAYTRWMLNFNHHQHRYDHRDRWAFFNRQMANDYYRVWDGLYSRVLPVYGKPDEPGDYDARRMYSRPKTRIEKAPGERLDVTFFPEGGHLVEGLESCVAFEAVDQYGEAQNVKGSLFDGDRKIGMVTTSHMGRGSFNVVPQSDRLKVRFTWRGKDYSFNLPKAEKSGAVLTVADGKHLTIQSRTLPQDREYAVSILCRGALKYFEKVDLSSNSKISITLPLDSLPVGVNDITLFDSEGQILADRLFFVKGGATDDAITLLGNLKSTTTFSPYQQASVSVQLPEPNTTFSLSVRDAVTDEPTYDDGNLMTDMLLSSELKGFIARPAYYFESDDDTHLKNLDLLMMVQGWRKYNWQQLADTSFAPRYQPETTMTVSGAVYKMADVPEVLQDEVSSWKNGVGYKSRDDDDLAAAETDTEDTGVETVDTSLPVDVLSLSDNYNTIGTNNKTIRNEVLVEAELILGDEIVGGVQKTENGHFLFQIPPFYGATFLNLKAYKESDSIRRSMSSRSDKTVFREDAYPDYYVKRDMPYPVYTQKYNFYQNHAPEWVPEPIEEDSLSEFSMENDVHQLRNVNVKGHRRGKRAVDWQKPAFVRDAYDLYNDITDYGLSFGYFDMRQFPMQIARFLYGNMGRHVQYNVDGRLFDRTYWRNYDFTGGVDNADLAAEIRESQNMRSAASIFENIKLSRLQNIRVFSDYEPRKEDSTMVSSQYEPDVTIEMVPIEFDGRQVVFRDRHIYYYGMSEPAEFYQPDYSYREVGSSPADYRRTLYWNPNARADEEGRFTATFYNNGKETRIRISAAGVSPSGRLMFSK